MCCIKKTPVLQFPGTDNEAFILICERNSLFSINFSLKMFYEGSFKINYFSTFDICVSSLAVICSGVSASRPTCRPAESRPPPRPFGSHACPLLSFHLPSPSRHAFPSTIADITMEACRGLLICSQLQPCKLLHGKDFKLLWNWEEQLETSRKQTGDRAHR